MSGCSHSVAVRACANAIRMATATLAPSKAPPARLVTSRQENVSDVSPPAPLPLSFNWKHVGGFKKHGAGQQQALDDTQAASVCGACLLGSLPFLGGRDNLDAIALQVAPLNAEQFWPCMTLAFTHYAAKPGVQSHMLHHELLRVVRGRETAGRKGAVEAPQVRMRENAW